MKNSFNRLLVALAVFDNLFISLLLLDYSFIRGLSILSIFLSILIYQLFSVFMVDEVRKANVVRTSKQGAFTRKKNHLVQLLEGAAQSNKLNAAYKDLSDSFKILEQAHEDFMLVVDEAEMETEASYLDESAKMLSEFDLRVSKAIENQAKVASDLEEQKKRDDDKAAKEREYDVALAVFKTNITGFGKPSTHLTRLSEEKTISFEDMRQEVAKLELSYEKLVGEKVVLINLNPAADLSAEMEQFNILVVQEVEQCKSTGLAYVKDAPPVTTTTAATISPGGGSTRASTFSTTKRETVMLPQFSGDEKSAFLQYPVWKKQWLSHISEYEMKYRATMLLNHLDVKAKEHIIGYENKYDKAMEKLAYSLILGSVLPNVEDN